MQQVDLGKMGESAEGMNKIFFWHLLAIHNQPLSILAHFLDSAEEALGAIRYRQPNFQIRNPKINQSMRV